MAGPQRSSNVREEQMQKAVIAIVPGLIGLGIAITFFVFSSPSTIGLRWVLMVGSVGAIGYGLRIILQMRQVGSVRLDCPFCGGKNFFTTAPQGDVRCDKCNRDIPVLDGRVLKVHQVRCGFCGELNYFSEKSTGLLCESCDREIPISTDDSNAPSPALQTYAMHDPTKVRYNLVLVDAGVKREVMIPTLQKMLALNRNQIKDIIDRTPAILLQGVPKMKAELLAAEIKAKGGVAEANPVE